jgi:hypothetical protein
MLIFLKCSVNDYSVCCNCEIKKIINELMEGEASVLFCGNTFLEIIVF